MDSVRSAAALAHFLPEGCGAEASASQYGACLCGYLRHPPRHPYTGSHRSHSNPRGIPDTALAQLEFCMEMLMDVFLFSSLGLTLSKSLPRSWCRWLRIAFKMRVSYEFSAGTECAPLCDGY